MGCHNVYLELRPSSEIRPERFGKQNVAIGLLIGFQQRDEKPGQRQAGTVKSVTENIFTFAVFVAQIHASRLEILEVAA